MKKYDYVQSSKSGYHYLRYRGQRASLDGEPGSAEFDASYRAALATAQARAQAKERPAPAAKKSPAVGTLRANVDRYLGSASFATLAPGTQDLRRRTLTAWCDGNNKRSVPYGHLPLADITAAAFDKMMYAREHTPGAQRHFLCTVRHFLKDCKRARTIAKDFDPTRDVHCGRGQNPEGLRCWPARYIEQYREHWPRGTMQRLALELLYESGAACVDVIKLGRDNVEDGLICFTRQKTGTESWRPFTPGLERELAAGPVVTIGGPWLRTERGGPFTAWYFSQRFRAWAQEAGIPKGYGAHGVRKRAATDLAEIGEGMHTLMAEFGWRDPDQAVHYTRTAEMKRLAMARAAKIRTGTEGR